ncbi:MAG: hypothetical protein HY302_13140 [Opitutae bacterium]|nr:hypothetical protein [Opitutae bacterium]
MKLPLYAWLLAAAAALLAVGFFVLQSDNTALRENSVAQLQQIAALRQELDRSREHADVAGRRAVELDSQLALAKTRLKSNDTGTVQLARELHTLRSQLAEREQRESALSSELAAVKQQLAAAISARAETEAAGNTAPGAASASVAPGQIAPIPADAPAPAAAIAATPADPAHTVVRVGPRDAFVVLDYGTDHGASVGRLVLLRRGANTVACVRISDARPAFSVAQVLPESLKGQLQPGDLVSNPAAAPDFFFPIIKDRG